MVGVCIRLVDFIINGSSSFLLSYKMGSLTQCYERSQPIIGILVNPGRNKSLSFPGRKGPDTINFTLIGWLISMRDGSVLEATGFVSVADILDSL